MADEFRVSEENLERSRYLADRLRDYVSTYSSSGPEVTLRGQRDKPAEIAREFSEETPLGDVLEDVRSIGRQMYAAKVAGLPIAVLTVKGVGMVPIIDPLLALSWSGDRVAPQTALEGFRRGLSLFLGYRFEGVSFWRRQPEGSASNSSGRPLPGSAAPGGSGFYIQLSCVHHHLAAYASPAYALTWRNLGSFTTPAKGVLPPGTWIFGAQGGAYSHITPDPNPVHVPPTFTPSTTCF